MKRKKQAVSLFLRKIANFIGLPTNKTDKRKSSKVFPRTNRRKYKESPSSLSWPYWASFLGLAGFVVAGLCLASWKNSENSRNHVPNGVSVLAPPVEGRKWLKSSQRLKTIAKDKATTSLPCIMFKGNSKMKNAGIGVFTYVDLPSGIFFGPYKGEISATMPKDSDYSWRLHQQNGSDIWIDAKDPNKSNWLRYINSARYEEEQNLFPLPFENRQVYYVTYKKVKKNTELLEGQKMSTTLSSQKESEEKDPIQQNHNADNIDAKAAEGFGEKEETQGVSSSVQLQSTQKKSSSSSTAQVPPQAEDASSKNAKDTPLPPTTSGGESEQPADLQIKTAVTQGSVSKPSSILAKSKDLASSSPKVRFDTTSEKKGLIVKTKPVMELLIKEELSVSAMIQGLEHRIQLLPDSYGSYGTIKFLLMKSGSVVDRKVAVCLDQKGEEIASQEYDLSELLAISCGTKEPPVRLKKGRPVARKVSRKKKKVGTESSSADLAECRMFVYFIKRRPGNKGIWRLRMIPVDFESEQICTEWDKVLSDVLKQQQFRPKSLIVFVNPFGGKRRAPQIFAKNVKPVLKLAGIDFSVIETERANHALETVRDVDNLEEFQGVVSVGGDGLFNEVLCGLVMREQNSKRIDYNNPVAMLARPKLRIGLIPAGSTNALACTVMGSDDVTTAALHIALGDESGIDVCAVYEEEKLIRFASTMLSFGFLGDVLKDSETKRCLGPIRYRVSGAKIMLKHPSYFGRVEFRPVFDADNPDVERMNLAYRSKAPARCHSECNICCRIRSGSVKSVDSARGLEATRDLYTRHVTEDFIHVVAVVTPCLSRLSPDGLSPSSHLGDGTLDLGLVAGIGRIQNAKFMMEAMSKGANHVKRDFVHMFRVTRFCYTPGSELDLGEEETEGDLTPRALNIRSMRNSGRRLRKEGRGGSEEEYKGTWNMDGEVFKQPNNTLHFRVHRQLIKLFARGIELGPNESSKCCGIRCCAKPHSIAID